MHKMRYNALRLQVKISPRGPLLIKAGGISANPALPDMQFVRTYRADGEETLYIPGSSLKGVVRSFIERVLRTFGEERREDWRWACPTFPDSAGSCAKRLEKEKNSAIVYREACGACRIFGFTRLRGRIAFTDFYPLEEVKTEIRYGVAISRLSHAVAQGPFEMEIAVAGTFGGAILLENYEIWQLGLVALALEAMNQGLVKLGFGKNRGFGEVNVVVEEAHIDEKTPVEDKSLLRGIGAFMKDSLDYGLYPPASLDGMPEPIREEVTGFYLRRVYDGAGWNAIAQKAIEALGEM